MSFPSLSRPVALALGMFLLVLGACSGGDSSEQTREQLEERAAGQSATAGSSVGGSITGGSAAGVVLLRIDTQISTGALTRVRRATKQALATDAKTLIIELDTPGGAIDTMWKLGRAIADASASGLQTVAWINDKALSAGVLLALACDRIYSVPQGSIGAAAPVVIGPAGMQELPEEIAEKQKSALRAQFRAWAEKRNRPEVLAEAMVDSRVEVLEVEIDMERRLLTRAEWEDLQTRGEPGRLIRKVDGDQSLLTLTATEAMEFGFIDGLAPTMERLLDKVGHSGESPAVVDAFKSEDLVDFLSMIAPLLLGAGLTLLWLELKAPGFGIAGILGLGCLAIVLTGRYLAGLADIPHLAMVGLGVLLIAVELFVLPGTIWIGLVGGLLFVGGLFLAQVGPGFQLSNPLDRQLAFDESFQLIVILFLSLLGALLVMRFLSYLPFVGGLVTAPSEGAESGDSPAASEPDAAAIRRSIRAQAVGVALTALRPVGKVRLDVEADEEHEARAEGPVIEPGTRVQVVRLEAGDRLVVRALDETSSPSQDT